MKILIDALFKIVFAFLFAAGASRSLLLKNNRLAIDLLEAGSGSMIFDASAAAVTISRKRAGVSGSR